MEKNKCNPVSSQSQIVQINSNLRILLNRNINQTLKSFAFGLNTHFFGGDHSTLCPLYVITSYSDSYLSLRHLKVIDMSHVRKGDISLSITLINISRPTYTFLGFDIFPHCCSIQNRPFIILNQPLSTSLRKIHM